MNRENINKVRDVIAGLRRGRFNMSFWNTADGPSELLHDCETAACIAGWTEGVCGVQGCAAVEKALGLTDVQASALFCPPNYHIPGTYSQPHAVRVLDRLLETGEVDWKSTRRAKKAVAK